MRTSIAIGLTLLACVLASAVAAQGTARSLDIQPGARENGLGAAGVALLTDASDALWWNPAGLGFAEWYSAQYTHAQLVPGLASDVMYNYFAAGGPIPMHVGLGTSGTFLSYGTQASEWSWAGAAGYRVLPDLAAGLTIKYIRLKGFFFGSDADGVGIDLGSLYRKTLASLTLSAGVNLQNVGPEMKFPNGVRERLSRNLKLGGAATVTMPLDLEGWKADATLVIDYNQSQVASAFHSWNVGGEIGAAYGRWARGAIRGGYYDDPLGDIQDATYGAGIRVAGAAVDFASIPQARDSNLPNIHKWTLGLHTDLLMTLLSAR